MTMLENAARAIAKGYGELDWAAVPESLPNQPGMDKVTYREMAWAVLKELQNPTDAMAEAGAKSAYDCVLDVDAHGARTIFAAMIDAALIDRA